MEKVLFIIPPHIRFDNFVNPGTNMRAVTRNGSVFGSVITDMPLGVLSMNAYIKKYTDTETQLVDFNVRLNQVDSFPYDSFAGFFQNELSNSKCVDFNPTLVAISALFTPSFQSVIDIAHVCRQLFPDALITAGGGVPTNMYVELFEHSSDFDGLCYGEGEIPTLALVQAEDKQALLAAHPSWITPEKSAAGVKFEHSFIVDLDEIPVFDYTLCDMASYGINPAITAFAPVGTTKAMNFHVMTSRGCPHHCCFCASHTVHGRKMRYHSLKWVREMFTRLRDEYGAQTLVFQDDHFLADKKRAVEIIDMIQGLKLKVVFQNALALYALDRSLLEKLKEAGINQIVLPIESGSERVLKEIMHKPLTESIIKRVSADCRELGIYTNSNILIGLPGETPTDIDNAVAFLKSIYSNWYIILCATPLVGSEMFDICREKDYIRGDYIECDFKKTIVETPDFTPEWLQERAYRMNLELNFVCNSDFRLGHYEDALKGFENAIRARSDHALAHYYAARCHGALGRKDEEASSDAKVKQILSESEFWRNYFVEFKIPVALESGLDQKGDIRV